MRRDKFKDIMTKAKHQQSSAQQPVLTQQFSKNHHKERRILEERKSIQIPMRLNNLI